MLLCSQMNFEDTGNYVIPALIDDCEIPQLLADRQVIDLRYNFHELFNVW